jgi:ABC-2 type transport system permease protein
MGLLFLSELGLADLLRERHIGTLRRLRTAPLGAGWIALEKMILTFILCLLGFVIMIVSAILVLGVSWGSLTAVFIVGAAAALAATGLISPLYGILRSERQAGLISSLVILAMSFMGGSFWPVEMMPPSFRNVAPFTLNYWAMEGFRSLMRGESTVDALRASLPVLLAIAAVGWIVGVYLLRRFIRSHA